MRNRNPSLVQADASILGKPIEADPPSVFYEGPSGTSQQRAVGLFETVSPTQAYAMPSLRQIVTTIDQTPRGFGILPMETSIDGELLSSLDLLIFHTRNVLAIEEVVLVEEIRAFGTREKGEVPRIAMSHPDILKLCSGFLLEYELAEHPVVSTEEACRLVSAANDASRLALAPAAVGERFGLAPVDAEVSDAPDIRTRFLLIGRDRTQPTGNDRTSLVVTPGQDRVGTLEDIAHVFSENGLNMLSIVSRALDAYQRSHCFHIICEGHVADAPVRETLEGLIDRGASIRFLGSYPVWRGEDVTAGREQLPLGSISAKSSPAEVRMVLGS